jgi:hypothetical protein
LRQIEIQTSKESPQSVVVLSDKGVVAEIKLLKPGLIHIQGQDVSVATHPGGKKVYNSKSGSSLDLTVDGKSVLKVSGDSMRIEDQKAN